MSLLLTFGKYYLIVLAIACGLFLVQLPFVAAYFWRERRNERRAKIPPKAVVYSIGPRRPMPVFVPPTRPQPDDLSYN